MNSQQSDRRAMYSGLEEKKILDLVKFNLGIMGLIFLTYLVWLILDVIF